MRGPRVIYRGHVAPHVPATGCFGVFLFCHQIQRSSGLGFFLRGPSVAQYRYSRFRWKTYARSLSNAGSTFASRVVCVSQARPSLLRCTESRLQHACKSSSNSPQFERNSMMDDAGAPGATRAQRFSNYRSHFMLSTPKPFIISGPRIFSSVLCVYHAIFLGILLHCGPNKLNHDKSEQIAAVIFWLPDNSS